MGRELTKIERLDFAAKAIVTDRLIAWIRGLGTFFLVVSVWATFWDPSNEEGWATTAMGIGVVVPTVMVWFRSRYSVIAWALVEIEVAVVSTFLSPSGQFHFDWFRALGWPLLWSWMAFIHFKSGWAYATVQGKGWETENEQVARWLEQLQRRGAADHVVEIQQSSFTRGHFTYRFLNAGDCWAMASFKIGKEDRRPASYRVREPGAIVLVDEGSYFVQAIVDGRIISNT